MRCRNSLSGTTWYTRGRLDRITKKASEKRIPARIAKSSGWTRVARNVTAMIEPSVREVLKTRRIWWRSSIPHAIASNTAAIAAFGMNRAYGAKSSMPSSTVAPVMIPVSAVRPPTCCETAERVNDPEHG